MARGSFNYGGQAVLEGVMMRGPRRAAVAVWSPRGELVFRVEPLPRRGRLARLPFLRGVLLLWDALTLGTRALLFSAQVLDEEEGELPQGWQLSAMVAVSLLAGVGLFLLLPALVGRGLEAWLGIPELLTEGVVRIGLLLGYLAAIGRIPEIDRVFGYHGAEHKAIHAYEAGEPLTVEAARRYSRLHPRCGTGFLLVVVIVAILLYAPLKGMGWPWWGQLLGRLGLVPVLGGVAYEFIRLGAANQHRPWVRTLLWPTLALQRLTTREPDDRMLAAAIAALEKVLE